MEEEDLGIIFSQGPFSIFMYLWWQTSVELRVASAWAGDNICWKPGHLAEPSTLSGPGTASVGAQDVCLNLTQHLSGPGATSSWPGGNVCLSPGHLPDLGTFAEPGKVPV